MSQPPGRRYRFLLPLGTWLVLVPAAVITLLKTVDLTGDPGMTNMISESLGAAATVLFVVWFTAFSGLPRLVRLTALTLVLVALGTAVTLLRFRGFSGSMVPRFAWRFAPRPAENLERTAPSGKAVDLATT